MAHAHFEISDSGDLLVGRKTGIRSMFRLDDLVDEMDKTVDVVRTAHLVVNMVMEKDFVEGNRPGHGG